MNLLCPLCQKPIAVPDHYAGQTLRCPLCNGMFPAPAPIQPMTVASIQTPPTSPRLEVREEKTEATISAAPSPEEQLHAAGEYHRMVTI